MIRFQPARLLFIRVASVALWLATQAVAGAAAAQAEDRAQVLQDADAQPKEASEATRRHHNEATASLRWADREDFELARRGLIASIPGEKIYKDDGRLIRDLNELSIFKGERPDTVNPSMWLNAQLLSASGLFKVTDRVYQVRGVELANLTVVLGDTGYIVIDTRSTVESARVAI